MIPIIMMATRAASLATVNNVCILTPSFTLSALTMARETRNEQRKVYIKLYNVCK